MDDARSAKVNQSKCLILSLLHRCGSAADAASKASATVATHTTRGKRHGATIPVPKLNVALCRRVDVPPTCERMRHGGREPRSRGCAELTDGAIVRARAAEPLRANSGGKECCLSCDRRSA